MPDPQQAQIDHLVHAVLDSPKYRGISEDVIRNIGRRELTAGRSVKDAVKATKNTLHQIAGAYLGRKIRYDDGLDDLTAARTGDTERFRAACMRMMRHHASTRERIRILHEFYAVTLGALPPIQSILDVACGFNPLTIPWMVLDRGVTYSAYDIDCDLIAFLNRFFQIAGVHGQAQVCDVSVAPPVQRADVALVLKTLPLLEQIHKTSSLTLLRSLNVDYLLVSFPVHSLGGRDKRMVQHYESRFLNSVQAEPWTLTRFEFATELAFLVDKR